VDRACRAWGVAALSDDAQLVVNELVANAVLHAHTSPEVTVVLRQRHLHLSVRDGSGDGPRVVDGDEFGDGGRGLILVEALATAWGWTPTADGKVVWATLRLPGASPR
jgi:anti-sigma regulatory factor (Ser/Thr protein kinase)